MSSWSEVRHAGGSHRFLTTRWSIVAKAADSDPEGRRALEHLCAQYWPPVYALARRRGLRPADAMDRTQGFFADLLARKSIDRADQERGKFRTFLLTCFTNFLVNEHQRDTAQKRGGGEKPVSLDVFLDVDEAERRFGAEAIDAESPERIFERRWALTVIEGVMARLRGEYLARGREGTFDALAAYLQDAASTRTYKDAAAGLGLSEGAVKVTVHRMRQRFRELLLEEVAQTLDEGEEPKDEISWLLAALGGS